MTLLGKLRTWCRSDRSFFAAGACHVLCAAFLQRYPSAGFRPCFIRPFRPQPGFHVVAWREDLIFDWQGYTEPSRYLARYFEQARSRSPCWEAECVFLADPVGWDFCRAYNHRHPSQFLRDPFPRAQRFIAAFPAPRPLP